MLAYPSLQVVELPKVEDHLVAEEDHLEVVEAQELPLVVVEEEAVLLVVEEGEDLIQ